MNRLILLGVLFLVGCSASLDTTPGSVSTNNRATSVMETTSSASIASPTGAIPPGMQPNKAATTQPTHVPAGTRVEPLITSAGRLVALSWSPNSEWFVYRDLSTSHDYLYHLASGNTCPLVEAPPVVMWEMFHPAWEWLADNRLLVVLSDRVMITEPCARAGRDISPVFAAHPLGIASANPDHNLFVFYTKRDDYFNNWYLYNALDGSLWSLPPDVGGLSTDFSWSPNSTYVSIMALTGPMTLPKGRVWVMDVASGEIVQTINMDLWVQDAPYLGPDWISETQFVISRTLDRGPLLVTMGGEITLIAEPIFGTALQNEECNNEASATHTFIRTPAAPDGDQRLVWKIWYEGCGERIYHAETGEIEIRDVAGDMWLSPNGQWMLIWNRYEKPSLHFRPIELPDGMPIPVVHEGKFSSESSFTPFDWSPDSEHFAVAVGAERYVALYQVPDAHEVGRWWAEDYTLGTPAHWSLSYEWTSPGVWSPDGEYLLMVGEGVGSALFLIKIP